MKKTKVVLTIAIGMFFLTVYTPNMARANPTIRLHKQRYDNTEKIVFDYSGLDSFDTSLHIQISPTFGDIKVPIWNRYAGKGSIYGNQGTVTARPLLIPGIYEIRIVGGMQRTGNEMVPKVLASSTFEVIAEDLAPAYPHQEPIKRLRRVFSATTQPPSDKINGLEFLLPDIESEKRFLVLVVGQDLYDYTSQPQVESKSPGVRVTPVVFKSAPTADMFDPAFARMTEGLGDGAKNWLKSMDAAYVWFDVDGGVLPGAKRFVLNGIEADWILKRGTITAQMTAARSDWRGSYHQTNVAYHHDEITVEVKTSAPIGVKELEVNVLVDGKKAVLVGMESLVLSGSGQSDTFSSGPIRIAANKARATAMGAPAIVAPEHSLVTLVTDFYNEFSSQPSTNLVVSVTPARMLTYFPMIKNKTGRITSYLWKDALLEAANIAGKKVTNWADLTAEEAGEITNFIVWERGSRKVNVTVAQHAAMLLLRTLFIKEMNMYLDTLPRNPTDKFLSLWRMMVYDHCTNPNFGPAMVEVSKGFLRTQTYGESLYAHHLPGYYWNGSQYIRKVDMMDTGVSTQVDREAYTAWREAVRKSISIANNTDIDDLEDMVELTGQGFDPIVQMLLPRLVKLEERGTPPQLVWVPDELARLMVQSIESVADQARAIDAIGSADTAVVLGIASLGLFAPEVLATKIMFLVIETGMAVEVASLVNDYYDTNEAAEFALGSSTVLDAGRLTEAKARAIPGWGVALGVVGSVVGLGAETYGLVAAVRTSISIKRAVELLPKLEKGGLEAFHALRRDDQVSVLSAVTAAKSDQESLILKLDTNRKRLSEYGSKLELEADSWVDAYGEIYFRSRDTAIDFDETFIPGNTKLPRKGNPAVGSTFRIKGRNGPEDVVLEKFLGQGNFCDVYSIKGDFKRVVKICHDSHFPKSQGGDLYRTGRETVVNAELVQKLLKERDIKQLEILHFAPDAPQPYMIQEAIQGGKHHIFNWLKREQTVIINGVAEQRLVKLGIKSDITPDGTLPEEAQRAILRLFKKLANAKMKNGQLDPLVWEDSHLRNIFLVKEGDGFKAGILDQDRIAPFSDIAEYDKHLDDNVRFIAENPTAHRVDIESLRNRTLPRNWEWALKLRGNLSPNAEFFMAKMLEYSGRYIKYNRQTGEFEKVLLDPKIVEEFFPIKQWVDPDLGELLRQRSANPPGNLPGGGQSFNTLPFPEVMPHVAQMRVAA